MKVVICTSLFYSRLVRWDSDFLELFVKNCSNWLPGCEVFLAADGDRPKRVKGATLLPLPEPPPDQSKYQYWAMHRPLEALLDATDADIVYSSHIDNLLDTNPTTKFEQVLSENAVGMSDIIDNNISRMPSRHITCPSIATNCAVFNAKLYRKLKLKLQDQCVVDHLLKGDARMLNGSIYSFDRGVWFLMTWYLHMTGQKWLFHPLRTTHLLRLGTLHHTMHRIYAGCKGKSDCISRWYEHETSLRNFQRRFREEVGRDSSITDEQIAKTKAAYEANMAS